MIKKFKIVLHKNSNAMILKILLFVFLILGGLQAKSQILLNTDSTQIKRQMLSQGGILRHNIKEYGFERPGYYYTIDYTFPSSLAKKNGIGLMTFYLTISNKCFEYEIFYFSDTYISELKKAFNEPSSGLTEVRDSLKWINSKKNMK